MILYRFVTFHSWAHLTLVRGVGITLMLLVVQGRAAAEEQLEEIPTHQSVQAPVMTWHCSTTSGYETCGWRNNGRAEYDFYTQVHIDAFVKALEQRSEMRALNAQQNIDKLEKIIFDTLQNIDDEVISKQLQERLLSSLTAASEAIIIAHIQNEREAIVQDTLRALLENDDNLDLLRQALDQPE